MIEEYNDGVIELRTSHPKEELEKWENEIKLKTLAEVEKMIHNKGCDYCRIIYKQELQKLKERK